MSFSRYNTEDSVISSETVVRGLWSGDNNTLSTFFTQSSTEYYVNVYKEDPSLSGSVQFSIQYGNINGSGSNLINPNVPNGGYTPSRVVYGEYRNLVFGTEAQNFTEGFRNMVSFPIYVPNTGPEVLEAYKKALYSSRPSMIVERKSKF